MEMSSFRPESHVAQQSRRDKLRIQQVYDMEQLSVHNVHNSATNNYLYEAVNLPPSEMVNYSSANPLFPTHRNKDQESSGTTDHHPSFSSFNNTARVVAARDVQVAQHSGVWRSCIGSSSADQGHNNRVDMSDNIDGSSTNIGTASKGYANYNATGPLGPFTGYATILKSSKFLTPAQMLLDQICRGDQISSENHITLKDGNYNNYSSLASSAFYGSNELGDDFGVGMSSSSESHRPDYQQKKAKLMFMHEEICRRYKQYHQQIQMVVSSFETVAGLSGSTPYISCALKTVAKHFRHLKNAISNHLSVSDFSSPAAPGTSYGKSGDHNNITASSKLKHADQAGGGSYFHKHKSNSDHGNIIGLLDPQQQQVWRPQRGLPDRAVSVLRAWLFDHFLHPYPTDADKHMLAHQTGLTRNQVSNWFINARVRVWKPMVEEIHMLETQGLAETNPNQTKNEDPTAYTGVTNRANNCDDQWRSQDKRSRLDDHIPVGVALDTTAGGSYMHAMPYHSNALETYGGLGSVSLTLGLRQSVESAHQQQMRQRERQVMQHFGGHMVHDFAG